MLQPSGLSKLQHVDVQLSRLQHWPAVLPAPAAAARQLRHRISCNVVNHDSKADAQCSLGLGRREALALLTTWPVLQQAQAALAVQGLTAGRIPGLSSEPDNNGYYTYIRPEGKSGGHGVGWSEVPRYSFKVPEGWEETPVSIADLGGTEIDLRFVNKDQGNLQVVVAPVLRFADIGFNADVRIDQLNNPGAIISGFAPELFGRPLDDEDVLEEKVTDKNGVKYYEWMVRPHNLVTATAVGNRVFILSLGAKSSRVWQKASQQLRQIQRSFYVPPPGSA
eukprot:GHRR01002638.1.p1 GENE.GHRR01002638.1~~GHRR01002638.1.p1  ORF type:complete len:307 (+),score=44.49 GHRR01002638.1:87-923(+)